MRASLIAQSVKNRLKCRRARFDSWVGKIPWRRDKLPTAVVLGFPGGSAGKEPLGWEDPLEKGKATHSSILAWRIPWLYIVHGVEKSRTRLSDFHFHSLCVEAEFEFGKLNPSSGDRSPRPLLLTPQNVKRPRGQGEGQSQD